MELVADMSAPREKQSLLAMVRDLQGMHRIEIVKYRKRHSDRQRRYYFPAVVAPLGDYLRGQGATVTDDDCHEMLKWKFLRQSVVDPGTGEVIGEVTRSTTSLAIDEFSEYLEKVIQYLAETFGVVVQSSEVFTGANNERASRDGSINRA